jgi:hypothetical protein
METYALAWQILFYLLNSILDVFDLVCDILFSVYYRGLILWEFTFDCEW